MSASVFVEAKAPSEGVGVFPQRHSKSLLKHRILDAGRGYRKLGRELEAGDATEGQDNIPETKGVDGTDVQIRGFLNAQEVESPTQFGGTLGVVRYAGDAARRTDILGKHPRQLYGESLRLAAARAGQNNAIAIRLVRLPLPRIFP
jgi:hypothetical protein